MFNASFINLISLVILNCLGSGMITLPPRLALLGINSFYAWVATGLGAFGIGMIFVRLGEEIVKSNQSGAVYSIHELLSAQLSGSIKQFVNRSIFWGYWLFAVIGNAVFAIALLNELSYFVPQLSTNFAMQSYFVILSIFYLINRFGIGMSRKISFMLSTIKILLMIVLPIVCLALVKKPLPIDGTISSSNIMAGMFMTLWPFFGIESIVMERDIDLKMVKPAMICGVSICLLTYILNTYVMMIAIPNLSSSISAYGDLVNAIFGNNFAGIVHLSIAAIIIGSLHGWTMTVSSTCLSGRDIVPKSLGKLNRYGAADLALLLSSMIPMLLLWFSNYYLKSENSLNLIVDISTNLCLMIYGISISVFVYMMLKRMKRIKVLDAVYVICASLYVSFAIIGSPLYTIVLSIVFLVVLGFVGRNKK